MPSGPDDVLRRRLATQRITSTPLADPTDAVRLLLCVQAQDAPLAHFSLALRIRHPSDATVRSALDDGRILRTHVLRPTWHFVAAEDLRWLLDLTSPKVEARGAARSRQLGLDETVIGRALTVLETVLADATLTRAEIGDAFAAAALPGRGEALGQLVGLAELRGLICSGPLRGTQHTYALVDDRVSPTPPLERADAVRQLVRRFFAGHGPAPISDLTRWTTVTQGEIRRALAELGDVLTTIDVHGVPMWFDPQASARTRPAAPRALLLPTFDEAFLTYATSGFPRVGDHPRGDAPHRFAEAGGGVVIVDRRDVGAWKRVERPDVVRVTLDVAGSLDADQRAAVEQAAEALAAHVGKPLDLARG